MHIIDNLTILSVTLLTLHRVQKSRAANNPATYPCPDRNGSTYAGANGSSYHIECSTDYAGNDLPAVHADTFGECLDACDAYVPGSSAEAHDFASCIGVSWGAGNAGNPSANCYLKYQITSINPNDVGFSSGYQANYTPPESGATTSGSSPSPTTTSAASATHAAALTTQPSRTSSSHSDSHGAISVGAGIGIGIGAAIGIAIVAGTVYLCRRRHRRRRPGRLEAPLELSAEVLADRKFDRLRKPSAEAWAEELPAEYQPVELHGQRGPRAELFEIRGVRPEIG